MQPKNLASLFSKDETCSFLARLKHLKIELPRQERETTEYNPQNEV